MVSKMQTTDASQISFDALLELYSIPTGLRDHLYRVAGLGEQVCDNWRGPTFNRKRLRRVLLMHDIGNLVKMPVAGRAENIVKSEMLQQYGQDDHAVSEGIGRACGMTTEEIGLMRAKIFLKNDITAKSNDWPAKIGAYADQRLAPDGVRSLLERLEEAKSRYEDRPGTSMNNPRTDLLIRCAVEIERQVAQHMTIDPRDITTQTVDSYREELGRERFEYPTWVPSNVG